MQTQNYVSVITYVNFSCYFCLRRPKDPSDENGVKEGGGKRALEDSDSSNDSLSRNKQKKKVRNPQKNFCPELKRKAG